MAGPGRPVGREIIRTEEYGRHELEAPGARAERSDPIRGLVADIPQADLGTHETGSVFSDDLSPREGLKALAGEPSGSMPASTGLFAFGAPLMLAAASRAGVIPAEFGEVAQAIGVIGAAGMVLGVFSDAMRAIGNWFLRRAGAPAAEATPTPVRLADWTPELRLPDGTTKPASLSRVGRNAIWGAVYEVEYRRGRDLGDGRVEVELSMRSSEELFRQIEEGVHPLEASYGPPEERTFVLPRLLAEKLGFVRDGQLISPGELDLRPGMIFNED